MLKMEPWKALESIVFCVCWWLDILLVFPRVGCLRVLIPL